MNLRILVIAVRSALEQLGGQAWARRSRSMVQRLREMEAIT